MSGNAKIFELNNRDYVCIGSYEDTSKDRIYILFMELKMTIIYQNMTCNQTLFQLYLEIAVMQKQILLDGKKDF